MNTFKVPSHIRKQPRNLAITVALDGFPVGSCVSSTEMYDYYRVISDNVVVIIKVLAEPVNNHRTVSA